MEDVEQQSTLPLDVVQIVLGYLLDSKSVAHARQACKSWRQAAAAAPCTIKLQLPSSIPEMKAKLALLLQLMPGLAGLNASVGAASEPAYPAAVLQEFSAFQNLRQLELSFTDSQELAATDIAQLAGLTGLTSLRMSNISLPAGTDSSPLTQLQELQELSLVHHSKVSALMVGDSHLQVLGKLSGLKQLVLQGRMCSATDEGLMALSGLASLSSLSISWVPWQSQITQRAALHLLAGMTKLTSLQLGGAELLLPSAPYYPVAAVPAPTPAGAGDGPVLGIGIMGQQQGLIAAAVAAVARADVARTGPAAGGAAPCPTQGEHMRTVLASKANDLNVFKLQFNCCGTAVEKALLSLGDVRKRLTGLQWSYAKLSGPASVSLLGSCTNLRSLKLRLWYQDYNLTPFEFNLLDLTQLVHLRTLVVDKRPPFQQQLPAQQSAISLPVTTPVLTSLARAWPSLEKLQLGLARSDFGHNPLEGLVGFSQLKSLSVHCYDQGYDDGHFMLPIDVASLPSGLIKLDLMHAELFSSNSSSLGRRTAESSSRAGSSSSSILRTCSSSVMNSKGCSSSSSSSGARSSGKMGFGAASAFTSMLSESFSLLSRQASAECSAAYLDRLLAQHADTGHAGASTSASAAASAGTASAAGPARSASLPSAASTGTPAAAAALPPLMARSTSVDTTGGWLHDLLSEGSSSMPGATGAISSSSQGGHSNPAVANGNTTGTPSSNGSSLLRQQFLPPLPRQQSMNPPSGPRLQLKASPAAQTAALSSLVARQAAKHAVTAPAAPAPQASGQLSGQVPGLSGPKAAVILGNGSQAAAGAGANVQPAAPRPRLQNPFAAAAAAAAVHAAVGGCVAAVDPNSEEGVAAAAAAGAPGSPHLLPLMTEPAAVTLCQPDCFRNGAYSSSSSKGGSSGLGMSFSVNFGLNFGSRASHSKSAAALAASREAACSRGSEVVHSLPLLQHLQLKHCTLDGVCMDDIITAPAELHSLQLVEVCGLAPRDVALMPFLASLQRLTLIAAKEDAWLGLAPLRLLAKLPELRHLDWVVSERALPARNKAIDLQMLMQFPKLQVITLHTVLGKCEQLHAVSGQLPGGCQVRLMAPAYCEHASRRSGSRISRLLGAASCLIPGSGHSH